LRSPPRLVLKVAGLALGGLLLFWLLLAGIFQYAPFSLEAMESLTRDTDKISRGAYLATQSVVLWEYIRLFFWPAGLHIDYDWRPLASFGESLPWLAGHLLLIGLAMASARRWPLAAFAVLFYYLAHSVESGLIPIRDVIFEHRAYLPDAGLCLLTAWLALRLLGWLKRREAAAALGASRTELRVSRKKRKKPMPLPVNPPRPAIPVHALARAAMLAGLVAILLGLAAATWQRNQLWRDPIRLWQDNVAKAPDKARAWGILGKHWLQAGQPEQGVAALERALRLQQRQMGRISILDVNNLVVGLKQLQRYERALEVIAYMLAQPMEPMLRAKFAINRANIFIERKRLAEAEWVYRHVLKNIYPPSILARANLANLLGSTGRLDEAEQLYREVLAIDPGNPVFQDNLRRLQAARQQSLSTPGKPVLAPVPDGE
jgi:tetratricopeptide (TPR) repeat protein